jgi:putative ABC transport system permease protein
MKPDTCNLIIRSLLFYRRSSVYQAVFVFLLAAIISGSLLTGYSVRESLKTSITGHLGNTDVLISSGLRYFDTSLAEKISQITGEKSTPVLETNGYCQNFVTGMTSLNTKIYGIGSGFFPFNGSDSILIPQGSVAINLNLAQNLGVNSGDEIIIHFREVNPIPANAPFAASETVSRTKVLKVSKILEPGQSGNFTLGISQITPLNVFINLSDLSSNPGTLTKVNRLLLENTSNISGVAFREILRQSLSIADIGLSLRQIEKTGGSEIISDRIFIDQEILKEVTAAIPSASPVITYLANSIRKKDKSTPYSFVAALPKSIYSGISSGNKIVINRWLADDLDAAVNDTVSMTWYVPLTNGRLQETGDEFIIDRIVEMDSIWGDRSLMPEFPGIAGTSSCSEWDTGIPVNMKLIREKDETYWNNFNGTPKAFIEYEKGKELWGSNFGPATAIRFTGSLTINEIKKSLTGAFYPERTGFVISDVRSEAISAANGGVDFSTLFLSLGFFIILSCIILLALSVTLFFDSRKEQVVTYFAMGFTDNWIERLLFLETSAIALAGALPGIFAGVVINWLIINALNSVWTGAVQTNTLGAYFAFPPLIIGLITTMVICVVLLRIKARQFLGTLNKPDTGHYTGHSKRKNFFFFITSFIISVSLIALSFVFKELSTSLSFAGGASIFISLILLARQHFIGGLINRKNRFIDRKILSRLYYSFNPSYAVTPAIIIAAGVFAVFITGVNRLNISDQMKEPSGGTGGFLLWCESAVPVKENLNSEPGRFEFGLDEESLKDISFVQAKRSSGDDASCLNLNHITAPPLLGLDPSMFIANGSFSFVSSMKGINKENPWEVIKKAPSDNTIYGIADQTVLEWGLMISPGDTVILSSESGQPLNVIIVAGLKSSVFQGFVIIGADNFDKFYPSVSGSSVFLVTGNPVLTDIYANVLKERFTNYGISVIPACERLASFFEVTNTYLSVFTILGAFGMILGVAGLGFILLRNYNQRKREFAAMIATGYSISSLRKMIIRDQIRILAIGIITGVVSAIIATRPSLMSGSEIPSVFLLITIASVFLSGFIALSISVRAIRNDSLIASLRKE